jgi:hypothetical protein
MMTEQLHIRPDRRNPSSLILREGEFGGYIVIGVYSEQSEATRYLTLDEARAIRDWLDTAIAAKTKGEPHD